MGAGSSREEPYQNVGVAPKAGEVSKSPTEDSKKPEKQEHKRLEVVKGPPEEPKNLEKEEQTRMVEERKKLPHNYEAIMKEADNPSMDKLHDHIYSGVLLNRKRKKYWVDEKSGCNCFMLFARELSITWSDDPRYWRWLLLKEASGEEIETASLFNVCWLEVHGILSASFLTPRTTYEVAFVVMIKDPAYGWEVPVNLRLVAPDGNVQEHSECLLDKLRGRWIELVAGKFTSTAENQGAVQFYLFEYEGGEWKRGLVIKGAVIRPKIN